MCSAFGPEVAHLGSNEVADIMGCTWLGVVNWVNPERGFRYVKVVRVFGTELVGLKSSSSPHPTIHKPDGCHTSKRCQDCLLR